MTNPQTLGSRLYRARLEASLRAGDTVTQEAIAERIGVKPASVSRYEADKAEPELGMIVRLAAALGVTPGWLAFGEAAAIVPTLGGAGQGPPPKESGPVTEENKPRPTRAPTRRANGA